MVRVPLLASLCIAAASFAAGTLLDSDFLKFNPGSNNATLDLEPFIVNPVGLFGVNPLNRILYEHTHLRLILSRDVCTNTSASCSGSSSFTVASDCCASAAQCCSGAEGGCCPSGSSCCPGTGGCCPSGQTCTATGCCASGRICSCPEGQTLCGGTACCLSGTTCDGSVCRNTTTPTPDPPAQNSTTPLPIPEPATPSPQPNTPTPSPPTPTPSPVSTTATSTPAPGVTPAIITQAPSSTSAFASPSSTSAQVPTQSAAPPLTPTSSGSTVATTLFSQPFTMSFPPAPVAGQVNATIAADDPRISYPSGNWQASTACGETSKKATQINSTMQLNFVGTAVYMSTQVGPDAGVFSVFVDGQGVNVDGFRANSDCVINWSSFGLQSQQHSVTVQFKGASVSSSGGSTGSQTAASLNFGHFIITTDGSTNGGPTATINGGGGSSNGAQNTSPSTRRWMATFLFTIILSLLSL